MAASRTSKPTEEQAQDSAQAEAQNATAPTEEQATKPSGKVVQHFPHELFSARVIGEDAWKSIGVHDQGGVEWNEANGFKLPVEMFSEGALEYLDKRDDGFEIVEG